MAANKKAATPRKKKVKRAFSKGVAHIHSTFNNTIVTISDEAGNVIAWSSAGAMGYKGAKNLHLSQLNKQLKLVQKLQLIKD